MSLIYVYLVDDFHQISNFKRKYKKSPEERFIPMLLVKQMSKMMLNFTVFMSNI